MFNKRPTNADDDEEILRQQEEFNRHRQEKKLFPAAKLVNKKDDNKHSEEMKVVDSAASEVTSKEHIENQIANTFEAIPTDIKLKEITEKHFHKIKDIKPLKFNKSGFPIAHRRDVNLKSTQGSIFSQQIKRLKRNDQDDNIEDVNMSSLAIKERNSDGSIANIGENKKSTVLSSSDHQQIHNENLQTLSSMNQDEILAEKERLLSTLDPAIVQYLKSQKSNRHEEVENRNRTIKEQNEAANTIKLEDLQTPQELLAIPESTGWIHFNEFEASKLSWMKDISIKDLKKTEGFEARFDFNGYLLPYRSVVELNDENRHLYHHGDEPERPGYSLKELLSLTRSNIMQQRVFALNTLSNILALDQTGIYDGIIEIPVEQVFFVLRVCLDDNTASVLTAAVKALRNLVYFQLDETCLDNMWSFGIGLVQPILAVDQELEDDNTINDQQLVETNLVKCLARSEIFNRIRYIVNSIKPSVETIIYCIEILTRLARDSEYIIKKLFKTENLLNSLITYFLPMPNLMNLRNSNGYNNPLPHLVKLIRVLSSSNKNNAIYLLKNFNLLKIIISYLHDEYFSQNAFGMHLQVECVRYWTLILHYNLEIDTLKEHQSILLKFLDYHFKNTNNVITTTLIRQSHAAALFVLLAKAAENGLFLFQELTSLCCNKWLNQFSALKEFKCGHSQITSSVLYYMSICNKVSTFVCNSKLIEELLDSDCFSVSTENVMSGSLLMNNYETHKTAANLNSLQAATWLSMDHIIPVMQSNSCIPFLYTLSNCILYDSSSKIKKKFLDHVNVKLYSENLKSFKYYFNIGNWFTRCESFFIINLLKISHNIQEEIDSGSYYDIAVKCLCVFSSEQKQDMRFLLEHVVFSPKFYSLEVAMTNIEISERNTNLKDAWLHLEDIKNVYMDILGLTNNFFDFSSSLTLDFNIGNVIPVDWIYTPLVLLYSNQQKKSQNQIKNEQEQEYRIIMNCLRWILIYESCFESLAETLSPTEKYVRLACLFLGSDNLFCNEDLQKLLTKIFQFLLKQEHRIDFKQEISGLTNFQDFFVQLLEQYQAVSYGNKVFGNVLLFPLLKYHDIKYRKCLWSEYLGVVETFTVTKDDVWLNVDKLIYPIDNDLSLYKCYSKALANKSIPCTSVMYDIALKNVKEFK